MSDFEAVEKRLREWAARWPMPSPNGFAEMVQAALQEIDRLRAELKGVSEISLLDVANKQTARAEAAEAERDAARVEVVKMAQAKIGDRCEHHKLSLDVLEREVLRECPICWRDAAKEVEAERDRLKADNASLWLEAQAAEHNRVSDNEYLLKRAIEAESLAKDALAMLDTPEKFDDFDVDTILSSDRAKQIRGGK